MRFPSWREAIAGLDNVKSYYDLAFAFRSLSDKRREAGDDVDGDQLKLLAELCFMYIKTEYLPDPFGPMMSGPEGRTLIPDDLTSEQLHMLEELLNEIDHVWLKARVADTLWVRTRQRYLALIALESYLSLWGMKICSRCDSLNFVRRALLLAFTFEHSKWKLTIDDLVEQFLGKDVGLIDKLDLCRLFSNHVGTLAQKEEILNRLIELGSQAEIENDYRAAREYWGMARKQFQIERNGHMIDRLTRQVADSYVAEHEHKGKVGTQNSSSAMLFRSALDEYMQLSRQYREENSINQHIVELRKELTQMDLRIVQEMGTTRSDAIDISEDVEDTKQQMRGLQIDEALFTYAIMNDQEDIDWVREVAKDLIKDCPLMFMMGGATYALDGRITAYRSRLDYSDSSSYGIVAEEETIRQLGVACQFAAQKIVIPGLVVLQMEHNITLADCMRMASEACLVPNDRMNSWARGLYLGFKGAMFEAAHILIPQIEHWCRWLLNLEGYDTIVRENDGTDMQIGMEKLLSHGALKGMLTEGLWCELNYYFLSPQGANLRNSLLHGLRSDTEENALVFHSFWHLCLRIVVLSRVVYEKGFPTDGANGDSVE